ncbi:metallophosphoesterase [Sphingobacterium paucimobilis]|uniref:DNA mismatch repair protein MutT n=1 Tax=Sphingobacterium paucimobilis HER1398 TaxID=1346330 RepID=U2H7T7_9SPHI|nr:metallophosphoesterase [Sphingobacterium paucimobilis]ERJ57776.1 DNA mismatch repair protein MutT [Sphingobacterium paucimobilis HER1398]
MLIFNAIFLFVLDFYIFFALRGTKISFVRKKWFTIAWWFYSISLLIGVLVAFKFNIPLMYRSIILVAFFMTAVSKFIYVVVVMIDDVRRGGVWLSRVFTSRKGQSIEQRVEELDKPLPEKTKNGITRSDFLLKSGVVVASLPIFPLAWGVISSAYDYRIRRQRLVLPNLPKAFHGFKIAQISDVHSGSFYNHKAVLGGVEMLLGEKPDAIFFTGDLVNNVASEMRDYQDIFSKLHADFGVFSTLGNHDYGDYYYGKEDSMAKRKNLKDLIDVHKVMGWDLLMDENRVIKVDNEELSIVGVQNWGTGRFPKKGDLSKALLGTEDKAVKLLLSHDPSHWRAQVLHTDVDVMFAGHTHGMQFGVRGEHFKWSPAKYIYKEWAGLYKEGQKQLYVNTGYGFLGYPGRVGILPEITIFELVTS